MTPNEELRKAIYRLLSDSPEKTQREIADLVGCSQAFVSKVTRATMPDQTTGREYRSIQLASLVKGMLERGDSTEAIKQVTGLSHQRISDFRVGLGLSNRPHTRTGKAWRVEKIRDMAGAGYTSKQIAASLSLTDAHVRRLARAAQITITADVVMRGAHSHNSTRIVEHIVMDAEGLTADVNLVEFSELDPAQLRGWIESLNSSKALLESFIRRLKWEEKK